MTIKLLFIIALLGLGANAMALGPVVSQAYEIRLSEFLAPATENGATAFKRCSNCERMRIRVTGDTTYSVDGNAVRLDQLREALIAITDRDSVAVTVLHHLESDTVVSISVSF